MQETIGIIAGSGQFPRIVAQQAHQSGFNVAICGFEGHTDKETLQCADSHVVLHLGQLNKMIAFFKEKNVNKVCLAGAINKPSALQFRPDFRAVKVLMSLKTKGDNSLLSAAIGELEKDNIKVVSPSSFASTLLCPEGVMTKRKPTQEELEQIAYGWPIAKEMGRFDIGQCLVIRDNMVVAVECLEGTDATLKRGGELGGKGCIALKTVKPGQDERVDLPSIGLNTIKNLINYGYSLLAIQAGKTIFFDMDEAISLADKHGLSIIALPE